MDYRIPSGTRKRETATGLLIEGRNAPGGAYRRRVRRGLGRHLTGGGAAEAKKDHRKVVLLLFGSCRPA